MSLSLAQHIRRVGLLMTCAAALFAWRNYHAEVTFADGLRYIEQAQRIDRGAWREGLLHAVDHPTYPLAIVGMHRLIGGAGPVEWQRAAQLVCIAAAVLLVIPLYLVGLEIYGPTAAWLGCVLFIGNRMMEYVVINVLSECVFLLFWTWGLWAAIRFLYEGRFVWLPLAAFCGGLAYLSRPEGLLLPLALLATLVVLPLHRATRINWSRWWAAIAFLVLGPLLLVGPFIALRGGLGTKPAIARVLGTAPTSGAQALERDRPLPAGQTTIQTYQIAVHRVMKVFQGAVTMTLLPLSLLGLIVRWPRTARARLWIFTGFIVVASAVALVRLHATGGYCTSRHAIVPSMLLILAAAHGVEWLLGSVAIQGRWIGLAEGRYRLGPGVLVLLAAAFVLVPLKRDMTPYQGSFAAYRDTGTWLKLVVRPPEKVLDLTSWSLYFSGEPGYQFPGVFDASTDPQVRWVVVREPHINGHGSHSKVVRSLIEGLKPVEKFPHDPSSPAQLQVMVFDRFAKQQAQAPKPAATY